MKQKHRVDFEEGLAQSDLSHLSVEERNEWLDMEAAEDEAARAAELAKEKK